MVRYSHFFQNFSQFIVIHTVKDFGIVNKAEIDVFLELSCFFDDPADVGNLISASSAFYKTSLNIWKFMVHILLKPGLENFEHYFTSSLFLPLQHSIYFEILLFLPKFLFFLTLVLYFIHTVYSVVLIFLLAYTWDNFSSSNFSFH